MWRDAAKSRMGKTTRCVETGTDKKGAEKEELGGRHAIKQACENWEEEEDLGSGREGI